MKLYDSGVNSLLTIYYYKKTFVKKILDYKFAALLIVQIMIQKTFHFNSALIGLAQIDGSIMECGIKYIKFQNEVHHILKFILL